jgi:hypothetical protein
MARVAYILLCHRDASAIISQVRLLMAGGDFVSVHIDANAGAAIHAEVENALEGEANVVFAKRVACGWGEWSLVQATLNAVSAALDAFPRASHLYMVSGDCMPIKSAAWIHDYLDRTDRDFIESFDFFSSGWIKTGMREERLIYRHYLNERKHKWWFYTALDLQKRLGLKRKTPDDLEIMIGSQWWCLRRRTVEAVMDFVRKRRDVVRFFRTTWIPDETFFQTLVRHLVPETEIETRTQTFLMFSDYGMPVTFYNDEYDLLLAQDFMFARKISPEARALKDRLGALYASGQTAFSISGEGQALYRYLAGRGRQGRRFGPRIWEAGSSIGRGRVLHVVVCKKWHIGQRLVDRLDTLGFSEGVGYLFDEDDASLPWLGALESSRHKRGLHRRAFLGVLFRHYNTDRLTICIDPSRMDILRDLMHDRCETRVLEIECLFDAAYLAGHARRVGLVGAQTSDDALRNLLPTIAGEFHAESEALDEAGLAHFHRISETGDESANLAVLADWLEIDLADAAKLGPVSELFAE